MWKQNRAPSKSPSSDAGRGDVGGPRLAVDAGERRRRERVGPGLDDRAHLRAPRAASARVIAEPMNPAGAGDDDAVAALDGLAHDRRPGRRGAPRRAPQRAPRHRRGRLEEQPPGPVRVGEHVVEGRHHEVDLRLADRRAAGAA